MRGATCAIFMMIHTFPTTINVCSVKFGFLVQLTLILRGFAFSAFGRTLGRCFAFALMLSATDRG